MTLPDEVYLDLDLLRQEIRLFELFPETEGRSVQGVFHHVRLSDYPSYTALSYTWGDPTDPRKITVHGAGTLEVRKNLWEFLRRQSSMISQPKLFWVDALCINQSNVHERNHQVNLMRDIYDEAREVYIWLGTESTNSNIAMDYVKTKGTRKIRSRGAGFHAIWTREEGRALRDLCERPYWRRMWVIQEIVHARRIMVWCGEKSFTWGAFESLYLTLKILEDTHWFPHHEFSIEILQSSAAVTAWQRAHWRHPETPAPSLRTLLEVFRHWQCADIRDKIFALVSMASSGTTIVPDYSLPSRDLYFAVRERNPDEGPEFENMLSQVLGLSDQDVELSGRDLIDYKIHPPDKFLLRKRINDDWGNNCVGSEY
ncbi:HET-domain-containing protein [Polyplosphaeria fusca]|uniref:HET-domain-containing protein n=1 Tax=Polyplosphaeria fusca TaxID=682080 RepID=A0A9P4QQ17_9PLEO|nr:HET-domain-containing protein [Polyplosphaeria fusca]